MILFTSVESSCCQIQFTWLQNHYCSYWEYIMQSKTSNKNPQTLLKINHHVVPYAGILLKALWELANIWTLMHQRKLYLPFHLPCCLELTCKLYSGSPRVCIWIPGMWSLTKQIHENWENQLALSSLSHHTQPKKTSCASMSNIHNLLF